MLPQGCAPSRASQPPRALCLMLYVPSARVLAGCGMHVVAVTCDMGLMRHVYIICCLSFSSMPSLHAWKLVAAAATSS